MTPSEQDAQALAAAWDEYLTRLRENPPRPAVWIENADGTGILVFPGETSKDLTYARSMNTRQTLLDMGPVTYTHLLRDVVKGHLFPSAELRIRELLKFHGLPAPEAPPWWAIPSI